MYYFDKIKCSEMNDEVIEECSKLFSEHYGVWSLQHEDSAKRGQCIRLSPAKIRDMFVNRDDRYVALVRLKETDELVGHAFYLRRALTYPRNLRGKYVTWVLQLVIKKEHRGKGLGSKLLYSIWTRSDDFAWGLFTSNPMTVRSLEEATFRKISLWKTRQHQKKLLSIAGDIFEDPEMLKPNSNSIVNTKFAVDHSNLDEKIADAYKDAKRKFPFEPLEEGQEWFAFTFRSQKQQLMTNETLEKMSEISLPSLIKAYENMNMPGHSWAKYAEDEIRYLFQNEYIKPGDQILDLGCGIGRHVLELGRLGYVAHGVDFCENRINYLISMNKNENVTFESADVKTYNSTKKYDVILCLYDVLGSSVHKVDNEQIVATIVKNLADNGIAIVSVMNMHLTEKICTKRKFSFSKNIKALLNLLPSKTMQNSGNCFDGRYLLMEEDEKIIYKREVFESERGLPEEIFVPDKRYYKEELISLFSKDFSLERIKFVHAGNWDANQEPTSTKAKEILAIFRRKKRGLFAFKK